MAFLKQSYKGCIRMVNYTKVGPKQVTHTLLAKKFMRHDECRAIKALRTLSSRGVLGFGLGSCPGNGSPLGQDWHKRVEHKMAALAGKVTSNWKEENLACKAMISYTEKSTVSSASRKGFPPDSRQCFKYFKRTSQRSGENIDFRPSWQTFL